MLREATAGRTSVQAPELRRARLAEALAAVGCSGDVGAVAAAVWDAWERPAVATAILKTAIGAAREPIINGPIAERIVFLPHRDRWLAITFGTKTLSELPLGEATFDDATGWMSLATLSDAALHRLTRPRVSLIALYHPEVFPLPRFPLGISDVASAIRRTYQGIVSLHDMQLGASLSDVIRQVEEENPDIIGVSATFGQHDILDEALARLTAARKPRLLVAGGSLSALNAVPLLNTHDSLLIAIGPGEVTAQDLIAYWHGDIGLEQVRDIKFSERFASTAAKRDPQLLRPRRRPTNRHVPSILPELDLIDATLRHHGVMQLESSRGCTHACSFCPREHKGIWHGDRPEALDELLPDITRVFARHPNTARKIYLVDEEFIGLSSSEDPLQRTSSVASRLWDAGFRWESNTRVDQVYRPDRDREWNLARLHFWRYLRSVGLDRCLFGVESGVDSILKRFNKRTSGEQNVAAIRTLTALGIPIRCTYITFDPLMTMDELLASFRFQGRTDLMLRELPADYPLEELVDLIQDESFVAAHSLNLPFYTHISYMLVSMECLIGSPYLKAVEAEGLAGDTILSMGRRDARYKDPRIELLSRWSQRWVDRNFSLDYTLKSLEKLCLGTERRAIREVRYTLRRSAYEFLGSLLKLVEHVGVDEHVENLAGQIRVAANRGFDALVGDVENSLPAAERALLGERFQILSREVGRWRYRNDWELINEA